MRSQLLNAGIRLFGTAPFDQNDLIDCGAKKLLPKGAQAVIVCALPYYIESSLKENSHWENCPSDNSPPEPSVQGTCLRNIARYAVARDYHTVVMEMLKQACAALKSRYKAQFVPFVDNSPIKEVRAAVRAGLGMLGRNGLLITREYGSYCFIGEIVTDYPFKTTNHFAACEDCGRCVNACPGDVLRDQPCGGPDGVFREGGFDKLSCASYISQKKGELTLREREIIKKSGLIWGCDICQDVCPHNKNPKITYIQAFTQDLLPVITEENALEACKTRAFGYKGPQPLIRNLS